MSLRLVGQSQFPKIANLPRKAQGEQAVKTSSLTLIKLILTHITSSEAFMSSDRWYMTLHEGTYDFLVFIGVVQG
jgi:hypothetical protein